MSVVSDLVAWPTRKTTVVALLEPSITVTGWGVLFLHPDIWFAPFGSFYESVYRPVIGMRMNGDELTPVTSIAELDATNGSYWWDEAGSMLYVNPFTALPEPNSSAMQAFVRIHLSDTGMVLNLDDDDPNTGVYFWPWLTGETPISNDALGSDLFGVKVAATGELQCTNGHGWWHKVMAPEGEWNWKNKNARLYLGGCYREYTLKWSEYEPFVTMKINDVSCDATVARFVLKPISTAFEQELPKTPLFESTWPNLDPNIRGQHIPIGYGRTVIAPLLVDTTASYGKYLIADGSYQDLDAVHNVWAVDKTTGARTLLTLTTHYTVDLTACTVTVVSASYPHANYTLLVDVTGQPDGLGNPINTFAGIVRDLLQRFCAVPDSQLDLASFTQADTDAPEELSVWLTSPRQINSIISSSDADQPSLEKSVLGLVRQTREGKWQVRIRSPLQTSSTIQLANKDFKSFSPEPTLESAFASTKVFYGRQPTANTFSIEESVNNKIRYLLETEDHAEIYTFLVSAGDAQILAQRYQIMAAGIRITISFGETSALLYSALVGDIVGVTFTPGMTSSGMFEQESFELVSLQRRISPVVEITGVFRDVRGLGRKGWTWAGDGEPDDWAGSDDTERALNGFWADDVGRIDSGDVTTTDLKVWA